MCKVAISAGMHGNLSPIVLMDRWVSLVQHFLILSLLSGSIENWMSIKCQRVSSEELVCEGSSDTALAYNSW
jgi:hypothetical protein